MYTKLESLHRQILDVLKLSERALYLQVACNNCHTMETKIINYFKSEFDLDT